MAFSKPVFNPLDGGGGGTLVLVARVYIYLNKSRFFFLFSFFLFILILRIAFSYYIIKNTQRERARQTKYIFYSRITLRRFVSFTSSSYRNTDRMYFSLVYALQ